MSDPASEQTGDGGAASAETTAAGEPAPVRPPGGARPDAPEELAGPASAPGDGARPDGAHDPAPASARVEVPEAPQGFRAGFVCLVGRPNTGKSTLTNALVGTKVAITSGRPQTTRHNVRGVVHREGAQLVLVDTPGLHRPRTLLGRRLNDLVRETLADVDVIAFCLPANERIGPGDRYIARDLAGLRAPVVAVVTKTDTVSRQALAAQLLAVDALGDWADIVPVSAVRGEQVGVLTDVLVSHLPPSPPLYPTGEVTDEPVEVMVAELVREAALEGVRDELPHSLAVVVDEIVDPRSARERGSRVKGSGNRLQVRVSLVVERDSQKAIVIGRGGARLKEVGVRARAGIERLLGRRVYLDLHVRTARDWQSDPRALARLGF